MINGWIRDDRAVRLGRLTLKELLARNQWVTHCDMYNKAPRVMHAKQYIAPFVILAFFSCTFDADRQLKEVKHPSETTLVVFDPLAGVHRDLLDFNILQSTCALYVALRSSAWEGPIAFGREMDDSMVHWNKCPGGTMVACAVTPTANGDTIITGVPWPTGVDAIDR